ncbi:MAG: pentapeptide repeat-containing protein [Xenococcaceae cyanobacterium MO_188.B32]|nr:pentapeptide repeat-containing protein [Xenococcaceae cyanobacterium MO_188.B32]
MFKAFQPTETTSLVNSITLSLVFSVVGGYIGQRALKKKERDPWVRFFAISFAARGGTSFLGSDLTEANFTEARLKSTDLRKANLTGVCWHRSNTNFI